MEEERKNYATKGYHFIRYLFYREATVITRTGRIVSRVCLFAQKTGEIMEGKMSVRFA